MAAGRHRPLSCIRPPRPAHHHHYPSSTQKPDHGVSSFSVEPPGNRKLITI